MESNERDKIFDTYFDSVYKHSNILSKEQYDLASELFERQYQDILPERKDAAILDLGCGCGQFLNHLKKKGYTDFWGIDISCQQVEHCKNNITDRVEVADGIDFLKNKEQSYDVIVAHDVFEHIPKEKTITFLEAIFKSLKDNGLVILRVPNMSNPFDLDARYNDFTHEVGFTAKSLHQVLWFAGFREIQILPPYMISVHSFRNFVRRTLVGMLHRFIRFLFYIQDFSVPSNLDKNIIAIGRKNAATR